MKILIHRSVYGLVDEFYLIEKGLRMFQIQKRDLTMQIRREILELILRIMVKSR